MQQIDLEKLATLSSRCLGNKALLGSKEVQDFFATISSIDPTISGFWSLFDTAVFKGEPDEDPAITEVGNNFAELLISRGLSVTAQHENGTVLHIAASRGNLEMTKFLVEDKKADLNAKDGEEDTPLASAERMLTSYDPVEDAHVIQGINAVIDYLQKQLVLNPVRQAPIRNDSPLNTAGPRPASPPGTPSSTSASSPRSDSSPEGLRTNKK